VDGAALLLLAKELRSNPAIGEEGVIAAEFGHNEPLLEVRPQLIREVLADLRERGFRFLASVHGVDYYPEEPRLGVHYQLIDMVRRERVGVKVRLPVANPTLPSVTPQWPTANHQEREVYDMFGVVFEGHPDLRRILMPEEYEGHPQRRDFPVGGEPVIFTFNDTPELGTPE
jgi:NADH-quinone oxidoreductase subunit C